MTSNNAGIRTDSQTLFEQQQKIKKISAPLIIAIDPQTPANVGSIYRLADATASPKIIFIQKTFNSFENNKTIRRISRNTQTCIDTEYWSYEKFDTEYLSLPALIAIEITSQSKNIFNTSLPESCGFVLGSERNGVPDKILQKCASAVHIPMYGQNGSMNVSHALSISLYEWHRQHTIRK